MSLSWFIFVTAVFMALQSFVYKRRAFQAGLYPFLPPPAVFEGEEAVMVERIRNRSSCHSWLRVESKDPNLSFYQQSDMAIKHGEFHKSFQPDALYRHHKAAPNPLPQAGLLQAGFSRHDLRDAGLQETTGTFALMLSSWSIPSCCLWKVSLSFYSWMGGNCADGFGRPFSGSRCPRIPVRRSLNRINWKASARTGELMAFHMDLLPIPYYDPAQY